jgi:hypothetical protein
MFESLSGERNCDGNENKISRSQQQTHFCFLIATEAISLLEHSFPKFPFSLPLVALPPSVIGMIVIIGMVGRFLTRGLIAVMKRP